MLLELFLKKNMNQNGCLISVLMHLKFGKKPEEPEWANIKYEKPDYQDIIYYSAQNETVLNSLDELDPEMKKTFDKLGISIDEQKKLANVAVDIVMDSVSVATSFKDTLAEKGIIFCSISEAIKEHPDLVKNTWNCSSSKR